MEIFQAIHKCLEYKYFEDYPHFSKDGAGKGRIGTTGFILGLGIYIYTMALLIIYISCCCTYTIFYCSCSHIVGGFHLSCLLFSVGLLLLPGRDYDTILHVLVRKNLRMNVSFHSIRMNILMLNSILTFFSP